MQNALMTTPPQEIAAIAAIGALLDRAGREPTRAQADQILLAELPPLLGDPTSEGTTVTVSEGTTVTGWTDAQRAASWAFGYRVEHSIIDGRNRVVLGPYFSSSFGERVPPRVESVAADAVDVWEALAGIVTSPYAIARLEHVLFAAKRGNGFARAAAAAEAYLACAGCWSREHDSVSDLQAALAHCPLLPGLLCLRVRFLALGYGRVTISAGTPART